ncbi:hypothetical protein K437DRAFT_86561 [Tilletiaria anomala UBC 951]|uniref:Uncharacterized protein n=1 Tax=Tilletiaria anomala (strain ATCC 24038 / CBS 436.72 / UBC 951) TaxID=1037660 RepID=A0A066W428_TILAU|nr:uncharacterized protein K437DRAFT_86561 [Tilletiaria anomala UBC 951]KDN48476.1 hypothetical protein K437DRAFT_86561 [Tilletiaria anomala UBC 951]
MYVCMYAHHPLLPTLTRSAQPPSISPVRVIAVRERLVIPTPSFVHASQQACHCSLIAQQPVQCAKAAVGPHSQPTRPRATGKLIVLLSFLCIHTRSHPIFHEIDARPGKRSI